MFAHQTFHLPAFQEFLMESELTGHLYIRPIYSRMPLRVVSTMHENLDCLPSGRGPSGHRIVCTANHLKGLSAYHVSNIIRLIHSSLKREIGYKPRVYWLKWFMQHNINHHGLINGMYSIPLTSSVTTRLWKAITTSWNFAESSNWLVFLIQCSKLINTRNLRNNEMWTNNKLHLGLLRIYLPIDNRHQDIWHIDWNVT